MIFSDLLNKLILFDKHFANSIFTIIFIFRSGSLGATPKPFLQPSHNPSDEQMSSDAETLEDARRLTRDLRAKTRQQAQQIMAWRRAYKMQVN